jgi:hypothetical protein
VSYRGEVLLSITLYYLLSGVSDFPSKVIQNHRDSINHKLDTADDKSAPYSESLEELHKLQISSSSSISEPPFISESKAAQQIMGGFTIVSMNMRDASSGKLIWHSGDWTNVDMFEEEIKADVPKCKHPIKYYCLVLLYDYASIYLHIYLPTYCTYLTTHVPIYLPTVPNHLPTYLLSVDSCYCIIAILQPY